MTDNPSTTVTLTYNELSNILAALRYMQSNHDDVTALEMEHFIDTPLMDEDAIDALCEKLNIGPTHNSKYVIDPARDANGHITIRLNDGTPCGDTDQQPIATFYNSTVAEVFVRLMTDDVVQDASQSIKSTPVAQVTVIDPDSKLPVELEVRKLATGGMVGIDGSFLLNDEGPIYSPYDKDVEIKMEGDE